MLTTLKINGFRGITECKIDGLKRINLFVGRNNHGKSSILEALYLASAAFRFDEPLKRDADKTGANKIVYLLNRRSGRGLSWGRGRETLWYRYDTRNAIRTEIRWGKRKKLDIELFDWHHHPLIDIPQTSRAYTTLRTVLQKWGLKETPYDWQHICLEDSAIFKQRASYTVETDQLLSALRDMVSNFAEISSFMKRMMFIDARLIYEMEKIEKTLWNDLLRERQDKLITEILRKGYEVNVEDLTYMPYGETYQLAVKLPTTTTRADDLGDGARYSMIWFMVAALARNTAVLIEEPENHQHPGGLAKSLEMLLELIKKNNVQVFATTHSLEFIKLIEKIADEKKMDLATFFIEMDETGKIEPRSLAPKDSENLAKMGLDVRFLDII